MTAIKKLAMSVVFAAVTVVGGVGSASAQSNDDDPLLENIIVTAQRREQVMQEVPVSIEAFSGAEIARQGFRDLNELGNFSPSVFIDDSSFLSQDRSIRGFGTFGNALTLEQAVPIFVDGIHFGRPSQVKLAFLDPERVEILKGPQPVFFGMNASAGAFNIISAGPTEEWEGYIDTEYGNDSTGVLRAAVGGPLSDKFGIRVATKYETADGFLTDVVTGSQMGSYEGLGGRVILEYNPSDNLQVTFKAEASGLEKDAEATSLCLTEGSLVFDRNDDGDPPTPGVQGNERAIWADPPQGVGWSVPHTPLDRDCFSENAISNGGPFFAPPGNIREENSNYGAIDARAAIDEWVKMVGLSPGGINDMKEDIDTSNGYLDIAYSFSNGIVVDWLSGWSNMTRVNSRDNSNTPFLLNMQNRGQDFDQWSTELRFTSSGEGNIEWMAGLLWQKTDQDIISNSPRANVRRGLRFNQAGEEQEWKTAFATVTFNFMDDRASIDIGGRYTDLDKSSFISGVGSDWVFDVFPCDPDQTDPPGGPGADFDPATCPQHPRAVQVTAADTEFLLPGADVNNLWVIPWRASRDTPLSWAGGAASAVGMLIPDPSVRSGPYGPGNGGDFDETNFDPQVTIRFRPSENHSLFLRYAESFKAGGFDTGVTSIPDTIDDYRFESESSESIEGGSKGTLWDGRARYDVTLFQTTFNDLQVASDTGDPDDPFVNINAGEQQVSGIELGLTVAATDNLTVSLAAAFMDGEMTDFPNAGCTEDELANADTGPCISEDEANDLGIPDKEGTIDRTGTPSPKTPDWKVVYGFNYVAPIGSNFQLSFDAKGYFSDGYITDASGFSKIVKLNSHEDLNLNLGIGPADGTWEVALFGRNLLEARPEYNAQFDVRANGLQATPLSRSHFRSYGVKFRYNIQ
jgi:outer membrane receptor protein involved in Fe transport